MKSVVLKHQRKFKYNAPHFSIKELLITTVRKAGQRPSQAIRDLHMRDAYKWS